MISQTLVEYEDIADTCTAFKKLASFIHSYHVFSPNNHNFPFSLNDGRVLLSSKRIVYFVLLNGRQDESALDLSRDYVENGEVCFGPDPNKEIPSRELDERRSVAIKRIRTLLSNFFSQEIKLEDFKRNIDNVNKRNRLWGFKGIDGKMFFNILCGSSQRVDFLQSLHQTLVDCLEMPKNVEEAREKKERFVTFVGNINDLILSKGISRRKAPKTKSSLFFLSYSWQIQDPERFPIFYNSLEMSFEKLGFLTETKELGGQKQAIRRKCSKKVGWRRSTS